MCIQDEITSSNIDDLPDGTKSILFAIVLDGSPSGCYDPSEGYDWMMSTYLIRGKWKLFILTGNHWTLLHTMESPPFEDSSGGYRNAIQASFTMVSPESYEFLMKLDPSSFFAYTIPVENGNAIVKFEYGDEWFGFDYEWHDYEWLNFRRSDNTCASKRITMRLANGTTYKMELDAD